MNIAFFDAKEYDIESFERVNQQYHHTLRFFYDRLNAQNADLAAGFDAVCAFVNDRLDAKTLQKLSQNGVKLILMRCAGYNNVERSQAQALHLPILNVPDYSPSSVAEHTIGMILSLNRKIHKAYHRTKEYNFSLRALMGFNMVGKVAGIIGLGKIGRAVAKLLKAFDMRVIGYDAYPDHAWCEQMGVELVSLEELFKQSDIITLHCPLTEDTRYLINAKSIALMKPNVMLINTSRGKLIDTKALIEGIKQHKIKEVGLDVYEEEEQYFFEDLTDNILQDDTLLQILSLPNVLVTSHQAYFTYESLEAIARTTLQNAREFETGAPLTNQVR